MNTKMRILVSFFVSIMLAFLLTSCDHQAKLSNTHDIFAQSQTKVKPAPQKPAHVYPPLTTQPYKPTKKFFNVSVHNIEAREFFMGLVIDSNENIVVHPDVTGTLSLELKNVTLADVINVVEKVYGYDCEKTEMGYIVYPATLHTRTFKINHLDLLREGRSNTNVTSGQNQQGYNQQGYNNQQSSPQVNNSQQDNAYSQSNTSNQNYQNANSSSSIKTTTNTDFWQELDKALHDIIAVDPDASVTINQQSGMVVARAKPMQLHEIEDFINTTQNQIGRQVILEAKIVEVILDDSHQDGVNWVVLAKNAAVLTGFGTPNPTTFTAIFANGDFAAMVELLETQGKTNVLSSPKVSTLNNQNAIIKVGRDEYFVTGVYANNSSYTVSTLAGANNSSPPTPIMASFFSGIALNVTPQIDDNQNITLYIHPSITRVENLDKTFTIYGEDYSIPTPLNTVRESDSIVKAQDGQVIVLGGLMQETATENKEGVSGLSSIPYIGHLFRVDEGKTQKSELIILLKASIIDDNSDWQNSINPSKQRYERLEAKPMWK